MNAIATQAIEGKLIEDGVSIERKLWSIGRCAYSDARVIGPFIGTETEANALVAELNIKDAANIHFEDDQYWAEEATAIRTANDVIGIKPHGQLGHTGNPGNCAACHAEEFGEV